MDVEITKIVKAGANVAPTVTTEIRGVPFFLSIDDERAEKYARLEGKTISLEKWTELLKIPAANLTDEDFDDLG